MAETSSSRYADAPELLERLVAYLDGELDSQGCREIEQLLASDESVRAQVQRLERAWEVLDHLPRTSVDPSFTRTTVEMIAVRAAEEVAPHQRPGPLRLLKSVWAWGAAACVAAALAGYAMLGLAWTDPNQRLISDLPVLEHLDAYRQLDDVEFLRMLKNEGVFASSTPPAREEAR